MKHIIDYKLFEGISEHMVDVMYYEIDDIGEFNNYCSKYKMDNKISKIDSDKLFNIVKEYANINNFKLDDYGIGKYKDNNLFFSSWLEIGHRQKPNHLIVKVFKLHDSYWAVEIELGSNNSKHQRQFKKFVFKWYICDDLEGLELLFKEIGIPN